MSCYQAAGGSWHGGTEFKQRGYDASGELDRHVQEMSASAYLDLGRKYGTTYPLLKQRDELEGLQRIYENDEWAVYDVRNAGINGEG